VIRVTDPVPDPEPPYASIAGREAGWLLSQKKPIKAPPGANPSPKSHPPRWHPGPRPQGR